MGAETGPGSVRQAAPGVPMPAVYGVTVSSCPCCLLGLPDRLEAPIAWFSGLPRFRKRSLFAGSRTFEAVAGPRFGAGPGLRRLGMTKKSPGAIFNVARDGPLGCPPWMAGHQKSPGAIFNVARDGPLGCPPWMAGHQKSPGAIFNVARDGPPGCPP